MRHLLTFIASALMVSSPLVASQRPVYLRCDFKGYKGNIPSGGAVDITLDERNGTVVSKIWDLPIEPTDVDRNPYFGPRTIEFAAVGGSIQMVLNRETGWLVTRETLENPAQLRENEVVIAGQD